MAKQNSLLDYLRSQSQVDLDSQDPDVAKKYGPFVDCTSNQIDAYKEFTLPHRARLLKEAGRLAQESESEYGDISFAELAVEIGMAMVVLGVYPHISGSILLMTNPLWAYETEKTVANAQRLDAFCRRLDPSFDPARLAIKVPATWEGLQACRKLKMMGIRTLATTLFTMEQAILAAEAGCSWISPFGHELRALLDEKYSDNGPFVAVSLDAQRYYGKHSYNTRVKAAGQNSAEEALMHAGVASITLPVDVLETLASSEDVESRSASYTVFQKLEDNSQNLDKMSYIDDEAGYREAFAKRDDGKGSERTKQAIDIFCGYQAKAEEVIRSICL